MSTDIELHGNNIIEENIAAFLQNRTEEQLANILGSIRKQMRAGASFVVAVDPSNSGMQFKEVVLKDGRTCGLVFTSFEEQMKGTKTVSTFMVNMKQLFDATLSNKDSDGLLINAYGNSFLLDRQFISLILG
ncbi:MAG: SseB family protein [Clostridia bacterium]|nr:SseB family protein [Clostridia bacterium]